jgi:hypothetical protein
MMFWAMKQMEAMTRPNLPIVSATPASLICTVRHPLASAGAARNSGGGGAHLEWGFGPLCVELCHDLSPFGVLPDRGHQVASIAFHDGAPGKHKYLRLCIFANGHRLAGQG